MFLAMNRFQIARGFEEGFEKIWRERESFLEDVPGFVSFALLKGAEHEDHTLYASHSVWASRADFDAWTESESFRKAHAQASAPKGTYLGHPNLELFESVVQ
jgi:heme-degrading monooxygenase HmoA